MKLTLLPLLRCPKSGHALEIESQQDRGGFQINLQDEVESGWLVTKDGENRYPILNGIPRFVPESNYADNFGMQWNHFSKTQLDSYSGHPISANRFWSATGWNEFQMKESWVLDIGCGAGRFAEVALRSGAQVVAIDYSSAVDACWENLKNYPNLHLIQGNIYALPLLPHSFDFVYSLGVLQHTPDVATAFASLPPMLRVNGRLCVDYYEKSYKSKLLPKYWLRPLTKRIDKQTLFDVLREIVPGLLLISRAFGRIPAIGNLLKRFVPVANYEGILPLNENQLKEWALLDTFDWLSPSYDNPQTKSTIRSWAKKAELKDIEVLKAGHLVVRARRS